jgi:hypothetical protein
MMLRESLESRESSMIKKAQNLKVLRLHGMNLLMEEAETLRHELQDGEDETTIKTSIEGLMLDYITFLDGALMELTRAF